MVRGTIHLLQNFLKLQSTMATRRFLCFLRCSVFLFALSEANQSLPQPAESFNLTYIQKPGSCSYSVVLSTSCSSPAYTRDQISLAFGDAYGNQIYVPRLDDPSRRIFEKCSSDTFGIDGPCAYQICYVYLYRSGPDGWIPTTVTISGDGSKPITFNYNTAIPSDLWFGFDLCGNPSSSSKRISSCVWLFFVTAVSILVLLL